MHPSTPTLIDKMRHAWSPGRGGSVVVLAALVTMQCLETAVLSPSEGWRARCVSRGSSPAPSTQQPPFPAARVTAASAGAAAAAAAAFAFVAAAALVIFRRFDGPVGGGRGGLRVQQRGRRDDHDGGGGGGGGRRRRPSEALERPVGGGLLLAARGGWGQEALGAADHRRHGAFRHVAPIPANKVNSARCAPSWRR